eukprot:EG_transcript_14639
MGCHESRAIAPFPGDLDCPVNGVPVPWVAAKAALKSPDTPKCSASCGRNLVVQSLSALPWAVSQGGSTTCTEDFDPEGSCEAVLEDWQFAQSPHSPFFRGDCEPVIPSPSLGAFPPPRHAHRSQ